MWAPMVMSGLSEAAGSCGMRPMCRPRIRDICALRQAQQVLALEHDLAGRDPALPGSIRRIDIAVAVLPEPLSPTSASVSPWRSEKETSRTARTSPRRVKNDALRSRTSSTGLPVVDRAAAIGMRGSLPGASGGGARRDRTPPPSVMSGGQALRIVTTSWPW